MMTTTTHAGRRMWVIAVAILMWTLAGSSDLGSSVHAAPQAGVDPTGSHFAIRRADFQPADRIG